MKFLILALNLPKKFFCLSLKLALIFMLKSAGQPVLGIFFSLVIALALNSFHSFMVTDLQAKNQVNIYKRLEKKSGKLFDR